MREIKFRVWDSQKKCMYGARQLYWENDGTFDFYKGSGIKMDVSLGDALMQYTGLKDKNGVEIYEGDIVKNHWHNVLGKDIGSIWEVKFGEYDNSDLEWGSPGLGFYCESPTEYRQNTPTEIPTDEDNGIEVIGNIYENPELLDD